MRLVLNLNHSTSKLISGHPKENIVEKRNFILTNRDATHGNALVWGGLMDMFSVNPHFYPEFFSHIGEAPRFFRKTLRRATMVLTHVKAVRMAS